MKTSHPTERSSMLVSRDRRAVAAVAASVLFAALVCLAALSPSASNRAVASTMSAAATRPAALQPCSGCHGPDLAGRPKFSPSLHASGCLKHYDKKTFERVMNTGITNDGSPVRKPMPVFKWPAATSDTVYAYLKTLK